MLRAKRNKARPGLKQRRFRQRLISYGERKGVGRPRKIPRAAVPSFFTLMNLFCGFLSLIQVLEGRLEYARWLILLASFFDMMDGMMARLTNGTSSFGMELDSLCDIVSFGVAPAFMIYVFGLQEYGTPGVIIASLPALAGAVRLARFNVNFEGTKSDYFVGMPIPVSALVIVAIVLNADLVRTLVENNGDMIVILITVIMLSGLMVSNIKFDSVPRPSAEYIRRNPRKTLVGIVALIVMVIFREPGLLAVMVTYVFVGIARSFGGFLKALRSAPVESSE